jgi:hypothetical protein
MPVGNGQTVTPGIAMPFMPVAYPLPVGGRYAPAWSFRFVFSRMLLWAEKHNGLFMWWSLRSLLA